ncbi:MAG: hypothetical protein Q4A49_00140 [Neisseria sp.]|nr:hypothetical protein [Neisseria sp.]
MQFKLIPALLVFLGSYFPLAIILAIQDIKISSWNSDICINFHNCHLPEFHNPWLSLSIFIITGICLTLTFTIFKKLRYTYSIEVKEIKSIPTELINYSFPYIVSFMGVDYESTGKIIGLTIFLAWLFLLTLKSQQIIMNPILLIFGWNLYEANIYASGHNISTRILSKTKLAPNKNYCCTKIQSIYVIKGDNEND